MLSDRRRIDKSRAEELAYGALVHLTGEPQRLRRFLDLTGIEPGAIAPLAGEASFQAAVLAHLLADESELLAFAAGFGVPPEEVASAHALLSPAPE